MGKSYKIILQVQVRKEKGVLIYQTILKLKVANEDISK